MPALFIGLLLLIVGVQILRLAARTPPAVLARYLRGAAALGALGGGLLLLMRGSPSLGAGFSAFGLWKSGIFRGERVSRIRSATLEMTLDLRSGQMAGMVIAGPQAGRALADMTRAECLAVYENCLVEDPEGARLLEAYLDRRFAGWRHAGEGDAHAGAEGARRSGVRGARMTEQEAYEVLGLRKGASRDDIARAHRALMKKLHPDHGGSTDLAARVNEAKETLLRRHV